MNRRSFFRSAAIAPLAVVPGLAEAKMPDGVPRAVEGFKCQERGGNCGCHIYVVFKDGPTCFWCRNPWKGPLS